MTHPEHYSHKLKWFLLFAVDYKSCISLVIAILLIITLPFFCFLYICMYGLGRFRQIFVPLGFQAPVSRTTWLQSFAQSMDQTRDLREVMTAYLLYRCKRLCMLIFRVISSSLTKKSVGTLYSKI